MTTNDRLDSDARPSADPAARDHLRRFQVEASYHLLRKLGDGGMGEVWLAERLTLGGHRQWVAVKFPYEDELWSDVGDEALRMSRLAHDNIVPFVDSGRLPDGRPFVAMAFVDGLDLDGLRARAGLAGDVAYGGAADGRIPDAMVGFVLFMVLRALHHAHHFEFAPGDRGLVHRDVSPGNVLIDEAEGFVKLTDFGVAVRAGGAGGDAAISGKVPYLAPEVLAGEPSRPGVDLYALGVVAYELLTGFNPNLTPAQLGSVIGAVTNAMLAMERPLRAPHEVVVGVDARLSAIVARMLEPDPARRYTEAADALADVGAFLYDRGFGPTTASMVAYLRLARDPAGVPTAADRRDLRFLEDAGGALQLRPAWTLTDEAAAALADGDNPARRPALDGAGGAG